MSDPLLPVLFDTDIGSDIDDAVALAYLLRQPACRLLGITTVTGEPDHRARLADAMCRAGGRTDIPIHAGTPLPLLLPRQQQPEAPQKVVLAQWPHRDIFPQGTAVPFLRDTIRAHPGEITLLAVGPFTNVGLLFAMDPEIPRLLRQLVVMGGVFTTRIPGAPRTEWNAKGDPHATARMYQAIPGRSLSFGLDVTLRCRLAADECRKRFRGGPLELVREMAEVWFRNNKELTFHDPLAAVALFHPDICRYQRGQVDVELASTQVAGMTHWRREENGPHEIAVEVDPEAFFRHYFEVF